VSPPQQPVPEEFECRVTDYAGVEAQIVALRNANRQSAQSIPYMDWRYRTAESAHQPRVFWIDDKQGTAVGMAGLIPRTFWIDGKPEAVAVLGDISVNAAQRGKGLGKKLLGFMTRHTDQQFPQRRNLVIPTDAARNALAASGWENGGMLVRHVLLLDLARKLEWLPAARVFAKPLVAVYRRLAQGLLRLKGGAATTLETGTGYDARFDEFWRAVPKAGLCIADRSAATLAWRYAAHPLRRFQWVGSSDAGALSAYLIFELDAGTCTIYDVLGRSQRDVSRLLTAFIAKLFGQQIYEVQVTLNDCHPYRPAFRGLGFLARDRVVFQYHDPSTRPGDAPRWVLTHGDKDI